MTLPTSPTLHTAAIDVARNLFMYGRYQGVHAKAVGALQRRARGVSRDECDRILVAFVEFYRAAKQAVLEQAATVPSGGVAQAEDIDQRACLARLDAAHPGEAMDAKAQILDASILYWYLR